MVRVVVLQEPRLISPTPRPDDLETEANIDGCGIVKYQK